jgi:HK97 family phage major capsid protein
MDVSLNGGSGGRVDRYSGKLFASLGEQCQAIANVMRTGMDPRLDLVAAASGASESIGADGGYLVQPEYSADLLQRVYTQGQILSRVTHQPIGANFNGLIMPAIDETSRVDGSRWGGVRGYWAAEADTLTASKPAFDLIDLKLHKLIAMVYVTDEIVQDAVGLDGTLRRVATAELKFKAEDAVIRGTGAAQLQGILNSGAKIQVAKESGQSAASIVWQNIVNMYSRMWGASLPNAVWLINQNVLPQLMTMSIAVGTAGIPVYSPANAEGDSPFGTLMGLPILPSEYCDTLGNEGDIIFADFSQYLTIDKGINSVGSMHVRFLNDEMVFRFVYRVDGQSIWRTPVTPYKGTQTQSPFFHHAAGPLGPSRFRKQEISVMTIKGIVDLPKMIEWFSNSPAGLKIIDETNKQESAQRKAIAERLAEVRKAEASVLPPLAKAESEALERFQEARARVVAVEREYLAAQGQRWGKAQELANQAALLGAELRDGTPEVEAFIERAWNIVTSRQFPWLTQAMIDGIQETVAKARALALEPSIADLPKRLDVLARELPALAI